ncbi:MAG: hypothetical protein A2Y63_06415 [Candidatus Riflebacteria bacterium RBG_13_59_9]|nr:MAG: hypothetical protein A2Y63_06415 [Candidatus Riflebacteria bacterium RBG_13_59_9]
MNSYLHLLVLGVVQGLAEFLPVSSSGHLVLIENLTEFNPPGVLTEIVLHLATLIAVIIYFWRDLAAMVGVRNHGRISSPGTYLAFLGLATLATAAVVYPLRNLLEALTQGRIALILLVFTFVVTALVLFGLDALLVRRPAREGEVTGIGWLPVVLIGVMQGIAALPGISRSGSTIFMGVALGLRREEAARFSFLLFIPIALLAMIYQLMQLGSGGLAFPSELVGPLILGFVAALLSGVLAIRLLLLLLNRARLRWFGVYLLAVAVFTLSHLA